MVFSIGSSVACEQLCGPTAAIHESFWSGLVVAIDPAVGRWTRDSILTAQVRY